MVLMNLMIIWGSNRAGRAGGVVAEWVKKQAQADKRFEVDFIDFQEVKLPFFDEPVSPFGMQPPDNYVHPEGKAWAQRVGKADAFIIVAPEYNHGYTGVLKNALDWVGPEWNGKWVGFVSYGGLSGGSRAVEQLRQVVVELGLNQVANAIHYPYFTKSFDESGQPTVPNANENLAKMLDSLAAGKN